MARKLTPKNRMRVKIAGVEALANSMQRVAENVRGQVAQAVGESAGRVCQQAKSNAPVRTGALRDSLMVVHANGEISATVKTDGRRAPHGHLVEYGTVRASAHPFLGPALEQEKPRILADIERAVGEGVQ